jgi:hypothetical protein
MEWNGMEWNGMEWNGMEWNRMKWNGIEQRYGTDYLLIESRCVLLDNQPRCNSVLRVTQSHTWLMRERHLPCPSRSRSDRLGMSPRPLVVIPRLPLQLIHSGRIAVLAGLRVECGLERGGCGRLRPSVVGEKGSG